MASGTPRLYTYLWALQLRLERRRPTRRNRWLSRALLRLRNQFFPRDFLTGAYRRDAFIKRARASLAAGQSGALLHIDVDHFAWVNHTWGHDYGDQCLQRFVALVADVAGDQLLGRFGGEEFLVYTERSDMALGLAEEMRRRIEQYEAFLLMREQAPRRLTSNPLEHGRSGSFLTASIGVAHAQASTSLEDLLDAADAAVSEAKDIGRNCVVARQL
jgi:diguanylate cyclase (GGDEF)-like protein